MGSRSHAVVLAFATFVSTVAHGQQQAAPEEKREGSKRFFDPSDQQLDLSYFLENPRGFLPVPILITEPAVGNGVGGVGLFLRPRREAGDEGWARPNLSAIGGFTTENGTRVGHQPDQKM